MHSRNILIAKQLVRLAKELVAVPTGTEEYFQDFSKEYEKNYGRPADSSIWDLFKTQKEVDDFLKSKKQSHPRLSEVLSVDVIKKLLDKGYFVICSAGLSAEEYNALSAKHTDENGKLDRDGYEKEKNALVKGRLEELRRFIDTLDCPYYEVIGQFYDSEIEKELPELSFIIDLTDVGENSDVEAKNLMKKISSFCGNEMNQTSVIEGIGSQSAYVYCKGRSNLLSRGRTDKNNDLSYGRSTVRNDKDDPKSMYSWSDDYDWESEPNKKDWI